VKLLTDSAQSYFYEAVTSAIRKLGLSVAVHTEFYLVEVLSKRALTLRPHEDPLIFQIKKAQETESVQTKFSLYRKAGDSALLLLGFFSSFLERRGVHRDYVEALGGSAYASASALSPKGFNKVYHDLAEGFEDFAAVLDEVRESTAMRTPQDVVKLYEQWRVTRSPSVADRLRKDGVYVLGTKAQTEE